MSVHASPRLHLYKQQLLQHYIYGIPIFWATTLHHWFIHSWCFEGLYNLHLQVATGLRRCQIWPLEGNIWVQCDWSVNGWKVNVANQQGVGGAGLCVTRHKTGLQMYPPLVLSGNLHRFLEPQRLTFEMWRTIHPVKEHHILEEQNP